MDGSTKTEKTITEICPQAEKSWDEMHGACVSKKTPSGYVCAWLLLILSPARGAPTPSFSMHSCPMIAPTLCCAEEKGTIHSSS